MQGSGVARGDVVVVIPVYNEEQVVGEVITKATGLGRVVCVNDGSTDRSAEVVESTGAFLVNHPINMGQGAALQTGIEFALALPGASIFVTFDADGQHRVDDAERMIRALKEEDLDIVLGSRFLGSADGMTFARRLIVKSATRFSNVVSGVRLTDTHNGLRVFNRNVAEQLDIRMSDMAHASELVQMIADNKYHYRELPVTIDYTTYSKAKGQSGLNAINIAFDVLLRKLVG